MANETSINPHPYHFLRKMREAAYHGIGTKGKGVWETNFWMELMSASNRAQVLPHVYVRVLMEHPHFEAVRAELEAVMDGDAFQGIDCSSSETFTTSLMTQSTIMGPGSECRGLYAA